MVETSPRSIRTIDNSLPQNVTVFSCSAPPLAYLKPNLEMAVELSTIWESRHKLQELCRSFPPLDEKDILIAVAVGEAISNSVRYTPDHQCQILAVVTSDELIVDVVDYGPGIPEEDISKYLQPRCSSQSESLGCGSQLMYEISQTVEYYNTSTGMTVRLHFAR